jgi:cyanophycinase
MMTRSIRRTRGIRWLSLLALGLSTSASVLPGPGGPRGSLVIVGGGERPEGLMRRFVELAGGPGTARIAVVPNASSEPEETGRELVAELEGLGADAFVYYVDRAGAATHSSARRLDSVTGIWFGGGDQARVTTALAGSAALRAMQRRYREGAVVGGTSAGAALMSDSMITGNQTPPGDTTGYYGDEYPAIARRRVEIVPGLGFLRTAIVDQHFIRRERHNRLMSAVLERPALLGVGIDESTALEVGPDGRWRVLGESAVVIYDARQARVTDRGRPLLGALGLRVHVVPAGGVFDPKTGGGSL